MSVFFKNGLVQPPTRCIFPIELFSFFFFGRLKWSQLPAVTVRFFRYPSPEVSAFRAELKLGDFGWAAIAAPEGKVSKPPPTGEKPLVSWRPGVFELLVGEIELHPWKVGKNKKKGLNILEVIERFFLNPRWLNWKVGVLLVVAVSPNSFGNFHPEIWGRWYILAILFFRWVGSTTNQIVLVVYNWWFVSNYIKKNYSEQQPIEKEGLQSQRKHLQEQSPPGLSKQNLYFPLYTYVLEICILNATPEDFSTVGHLELEVCCWPTPPRSWWKGSHFTYCEWFFGKSLFMFMLGYHHFVKIPSIFLQFFLKGEPW